MPESRWRLTPFRDWRLARKGLLLVLIASTLPLAVSAALFFVRARRLVEADGIALLAARADQLAAELDAFHRVYSGIAYRSARRADVIAAVSATGAERRRMAARAREGFLPILASDENIFSVVLADTALTVIATTLAPSPVARLPHRGFIRTALATGGAISEPFLSDVVQSATGWIAYAARVADASGETAGLVVVYVRSEAFHAAVRAGNARAGPGSFSVIYDSAGIRIAHGFSEAELYHPAGALDSTTIADLVAEGRFGRRTRELLESPSPVPEEFAWARTRTLPAGDVFRTYSPANSQQNVAVVRRLQMVPWTLFYLIPEQSLQGPVRELLRVIVWPSAIIIVVALALGRLVAGGVLTPLRQLGTAAEAIRRGEAGVRVQTPAKDEIGQLAAIFNAMAEHVEAGRSKLESRVRQRTEELSHANEELQAQREELLAQGAELRAQQRELQEKNREVLRADQLKSEFLANMSHELRTPLNSVIGFSELVLDDARSRLSATHIEYLNDVLASARHLLNLINDILDLSRIEARQVSLALESVRPAAAIDECCNLMGPAAMKKGITVRQANRATQAVHADSGKLRQILLNLLSNAVKFSPEGSMIEVGCADEGGSIRFHVRDQGPGIAEALRPRLFQAFVQGESPLVKRHEGTGLGLAICKRLVELHGGSIALESPPGGGAGVGTEFAFTMPASPTTSADGALTPVAANTLLLLVDDSGGAGELRRALERDGYDVVSAPRGTDVLAMAERLRPAAIILDPAEEVRDGLRVLDALERSETTRDIPVVLSTAPSATRFLPKPIERTRLTHALEVLPPKRADGSAPLVLVTDDDSAVLALMRGILESGGYRVMTAESGAVALRLVEREVPDLFVIDLLMPEMSGTELIDALQANDRASGRPIIVFTAAEMTEEERAQLRRHVRAVAQKGNVTREAILSAVHRATDPRVSAPLQARTDGHGPILVVDDHDLNRSLARSILERAGHRVLEASDGEAAIAMAIRDRPSLIFMDLSMPGTDGYTATRRLKADPTTKQIPVVALTALAMRNDEQRAYDAGCDAYLTKPIERFALEQMAARFLVGSHVVAGSA